MLIATWNISAVIKPDPGGLAWRYGLDDTPSVESHGCWSFVGSYALGNFGMGRLKIDWFEWFGTKKWNHVVSLTMLSISIHKSLPLHQANS